MNYIFHQTVSHDFVDLFEFRYNTKYTKFYHIHVVHDPIITMTGNIAFTCCNIIHENNMMFVHFVNYNDYSLYDGKGYAHLYNCLCDKKEQFADVVNAYIARHGCMSVTSYFSTQ